MLLKFELLIILTSYYQTNYALNIVRSDAGGPRRTAGPAPAL
jgi:hypothetical protein